MLDFASPDRLLVVNVRPVGTVGVNAITSVYTKEAKDILGWVNAQDRMAWCRKEFSTFLGKTVGYAIGKLAESVEMYGQLIGAGENKPRTEQLSNTTDLSARLGQTVSGKVELAGELLSATKVINSFVNATVQEGHREKGAGSGRPYRAKAVREGACRRQETTILSRIPFAGGVQSLA